MVLSRLLVQSSEVLPASLARQEPWSPVTLRQWHRIDLTRMERGTRLRPSEPCQQVGPNCHRKLASGSGRHLSLRVTLRVVLSRLLVQSSEALPASLARQEPRSPVTLRQWHRIDFTRMERENEAPAERVFPASWTKLSSKTCIRFGKTLEFESHAQGGAFSFVSTVK